MRNTKSAGLQNTGPKHYPQVRAAFAKNPNSGFAVQVSHLVKWHAVLHRQFRQGKAPVGERRLESLGYFGLRNRRSIHRIAGRGGNRLDNSQEWIRPAVRTDVTNQSSSTLLEGAHFGVQQYANRQHP